MSKLQFIRVGGLSPVKYKSKIDNNGHKMSSFHYPPPTRYGIYAFIWPYIEPFLFMWKLDSVRSDKHPSNKEYDKNECIHKLGYRMFTYEGFLWCHIKTKYAIDNVRSFYKIHTDNFDKVFQSCMIDDIKSIKHDHICINKSVIIKDPYKPNGVISYAKDHLEVFIEGKDCANIR